MICPFFHNIGVLRTCVNPKDYLPKILIPYTNLLKNGHIIQGEVSSIEKDQVKLTGVEEPIKFDYLVIATGSAYAFPFKVQKGKKDNQMKVYEKIAEEIDKAKKILIVGGGPVGLELAGEISDKYDKKKEVTILHS